jgi:hypothetical protein
MKAGIAAPSVGSDGRSIGRSGVRQRLSWLLQKMFWPAPSACYLLLLLAATRYAYTQWPPPPSAAPAPQAARSPTQAPTQAAPQQPQRLRHVHTHTALCYLFLQGHPGCPPGPAAACLWLQARRSPRGLPRPRSEGHPHPPSPRPPPARPPPSRTNWQLSIRMMGQWCSRNRRSPLT